MRIGVNISDDLRERMKPLMLVSNISQVCRDAIQAYILNYEQAKERAKQDGMEEVANRLAKEMSPEVVDWGTLGLEDAKMWVQLAKPEHFERQIEKLEMSKRHNWLPETIMVEPVPGSNWNFHVRANEHTKWMNWIDQNYLERPSLYWDSKAEYEQAYLNYILAVWQMVLDRVNANNIEMENKFKEASKKSLEDGLKEGQTKAEYLAKQ